MFGLTILSMIFAYVSLAGCQFLKVNWEVSLEVATDDVVQGINGSGLFNDVVIDGPGGDMGYGFFNQVVYDSDGDKIGCLPYDKDIRDEYFSDSAWKAGRAFGTMTVMALTVAFFVQELVMLFTEKYQDRLWLALKAMYVFAFFTNLFTFSVFAADICSATSCQPGPAGGLAIFNIFILMFLMIMSWWVSPPPNPVFRLYKDPSPIAEVREVKSGDDNGDEQEGVETIANEERFMEYDKQAVEEEEGDGDGDEGEGEEKPYDEERHELNSSMDMESRDESVKITTEITPDGKRIIEVVTHPDGSKTVTTTIESMEEDDDNNGDGEDVSFDKMMNEEVEIKA
jgi:hypothetical protein